MWVKYQVNPKVSCIFFSLCVRNQTRGLVHARQVLPELYITTPAPATHHHPHPMSGIFSDRGSRWCAAQASCRPPIAGMQRFKYLVTAHKQRSFRWLITLQAGVWAGLSQVILLLVLPEITHGPPSFSAKWHNPSPCWAIGVYQWPSISSHARVSRLSLSVIHPHRDLGTPDMMR